ncbi:MAG TPA: ATP-binding protein [Mycobacteriales bacterium]|nr:ATP-binding protein [Mycobacteriales bacterium]
MVAAEFTFRGGDNSSVPAARHFVQEVLAGWRRAEQGWTAAMVVTELAANAALHAGDQPFTVSVSLEGSGVLHIAVADRSTRRPRTRDYSAEATTGRGLKLVEDLSSRWGVSPHEGGKVVWADIAPSGGHGVRDESSRDEVDFDALLDRFDDFAGASDARRISYEVLGWAA